MKFTPSQVIEMAREAGLPDSVGAHPAFKQALNLAADRALEAAAVKCDDNEFADGAECAQFVRAMKEQA